MSSKVETSSAAGEGELTVIVKGRALIATGELTQHAMVGSGFVALLSRLASSPLPLVLNITCVSFLDSVGLGVIVVAVRRAANADAKMQVRARAGSQPARVIKMARFDQIVDLVIVDEEDERLARADTAGGSEDENGEKTYGQFLG